MLKKSVLLLLIAVFFISGCAKKEVKFKGKVYNASVDSNNLITVTGPATTAEVWAKSDPSKVADVDTNGDYLLTLKAPYSIGSAPVKEYTLIATKGGSLGGTNEKITVQAVIGETNKIRDFILFQHTVEK